MDLRPRWSPAVAALGLAAVALWLRAPGFGAGLWNLDEAIHAAAARTILDGGVLYRDAIDLRTPLSYYAVAGTFALFGENNLGAVRCLVALLVAGTGLALFLAGAGLRRAAAGAVAGLLYVLLATAALSAGDANAANTVWFLAFFTRAAAAVFLGGGAAPGGRRLFATGALLGAAFLCKQPALLDAAAPGAVLLYAGWRQRRPARALAAQVLALAAGWFTPVLLTGLWFAARGAWPDAVFYAWTYPLSYYGAEITAADRLAAGLIPFQLIGRAQPLLLAVWLAAAAACLHRLAQRSPAPAEEAGNPGLVLVAAWSLTALAGAASSGRDFDHYAIQFLAPFCLGAGLALARLATAGWSARGPAARGATLVLLAAVALPALIAAGRARGRTLPDDPSLRVSAYIRAHSAADDRIFVWGFHPDIYLFADRRPASRYLYASFITGLIPWTNVAPDRDTAYAAVPGALEGLLGELAARPPLFIVDCSAGPNRHWQKYPLEKFPALEAFIRDHYALTEGPQFVAQGFRLFRRRPAGTAAADPAPAALPAENLRRFAVGTVGSPLAPESGTAPYGAGFSIQEGRAEYFAHAPSQLVYRVDAAVRALRGGFGLRAGAYAPGHAGATDGAGFLIRWLPDGGQPQVLLDRTLQPQAREADRGIQSFRVELPAHPGGRLELSTTPGPAENPASDWTFWTDLTLEKIH